MYGMHIMRIYFLWCEYQIPSHEWCLFATYFTTVALVSFKIHSTTIHQRESSAPAHNIVVNSVHYKYADETAT